MSTSNWMIYGANGYTGRLVAEEAVRLGMRPTLAGRRQDTIEQIGRELDCPTRVFDVRRRRDIEQALTDCVAVLNCAGPFSATAVPMMEACLAGGTHYLDVTGEIDVIEAAVARDERARSAGVVLMPAVGFDVVPTDCLAAMLSKKLPTATHLQMAWLSTGRASPGTMKTTIESLPKGGRARIDGHLVRVPVAWKSREIPFRGGNRWGMTIPWGDVSSAYHSTGIPNIEVYMGMPPEVIERARKGRRWLWLSGLPPVQWWLKRRIAQTVRGPSAEERSRAGISLWGRVSDENGNTVDATMEIPDGYTVTMHAAVAATQRVATAPPPAGFQTPSRAFGEQFVLELPDVDLRIGESANA